MAQYLALLETSGNQRYIFSTNKLRENVGASELTYRAGTTWVTDVATTVPGITMILTTSGKAYLLAKSEDTARTVITAVTRKALKEAPGLDLVGVFVEVTTTLHNAILHAHKLLASRRGMNPGVESRFRRLPVVAECSTSGFPANEYDGKSSEPGSRSVMSVAKRKVAQDGIDRMRRIARESADWNILRSVDHLDRVQERSWLAVVHADGNGLGKVFLNFQQHLRPSDNYAAVLREFSGSLDTCTEQAFGFALQRLADRCLEDPLPVVPIVLGGDDMTVVMDGRLAIQFTIDFLAKFEELTAAHPLIPTIMRGPDGKGPDRVTACAGVAVVKPHFPFYAAYELAEQLIKSAKDFAKPLRRSALDFHILYDASGADLNRIRESLRVEDGVTELVARPYLIADAATSPRTTAALERSMVAIQTRDDDNRRAIPNSHLHDLREALQLGRDAATARYELVRQRYPAFNALLPDGLFWLDGTVHRTHLLDAIDLVEFWESE